MTIINNMLKIKKMNGLKIFALVLLSLSKFETMFGMEENESEDEINDEYVNKNFYLIDKFGNKITLDNDKDIKFKIYSKSEIDGMEFNKDNDILEITEKNNKKILVSTGENEEVKESYGSIFYKNGGVISQYKDDQLSMMLINFTEKDKKKYKNKVIHCWIIKKIGEDSINDNYILVDAENNKIEKINGKNIVFKLLTRKKYLELKETINNPNNFLKNDEGKYILDNTQKPFFFEKEDNNLILYVRRSENNLWLANLLLFVADIKFNENNSIEVRMAKKKEINKIEEKKVEIAKIDKKEGEKVEKKEILKDDDSTKCCCGIF